MTGSSSNQAGGRLYAAFTGDLVRSSSYPPESLNVIRETLVDAASEISTWSPELEIHGPQFFRGDAWQLAINRPSLFLRTAVYLRAKLIALDLQADTRIAVGIGSVEQLDRNHVSHSIGEAFTLSGYALDRMGHRRDIWVDGGDALGNLPWLPVVLGLCSTIMRRWKPGQAEVICSAVDPRPRTHAELATVTGLSRQGVTKALYSAGWTSVEDAIDLIEDIDWPCGLQKRPDGHPI